MLRHAQAACVHALTSVLPLRRYASGATIQILLFAILAIQVKIRAPAMHTYLETIYIRWGKGPHIVFMVFGFLCNCIVTSMLMLGGAATIEQLTGVHKVSMLCLSCRPPAELQPACSSLCPRFLCACC